MHHDRETILIAPDRWEELLRKFSGFFLLQSANRLPGWRSPVRSDAGIAVREKPRSKWRDIARSARTAATRRVCAGAEPAPVPRTLVRKRRETENSLPRPATRFEPAAAALPKNRRTVSGRAPQTVRSRPGCNPAPAACASRYTPTHPWPCTGAWRRHPAWGV